MENLLEECLDVSFGTGSVGPHPATLVAQITMVNPFA